MTTKAPCVLVTGVGAIIGQGIIKALHMPEQPVRIIGLDLNPEAFGAAACDAFYAKPADDQGQQYLDFLASIIESEGVDLILPGIEHDVFFLDDNRAFFSQLNCVPVINDRDLIAISKDKWLTAETLGANGLPVIPGVLPTSWQDCLEKLGPAPLLMKPCSGNGSRGIVRLHDELDYSYWMQKSDGKYMVQTIVGSDTEEYTASVFGYGDGEATSAIIFRRKLSADGSTLSAEVVTDAAISAFIMRLNSLFKPLGPTNYQFRKEDDRVYMLEVNPRISSATSFRAAFGFNEAWMSIDYFINGIRPELSPLKQGRAVRYVEDRIEFL